MGMFNTLVLDPKIIDNEGECNGLGDVFPEARSVGHFEVAVFFEAFLDEFVGKDAGL